MNPDPKRTLSREFIIKSIMQVIDAVPVEKRWGSVEISFQAGAFKTIKEVKTTVTEE